MKKNVSVFRSVFLFLFILLLLATAAVSFLHSRLLFADYAPIETTESAASLSNPYRGFYELYGYTLSEENTTSDAAKWSRRTCHASSYPLLLLQINLKNYANESLSSAALEQLDKILIECTREKKQIILRFLYDWDGKAQTSEPDDLGRILEHIRQLAPVVNKHSDCVYLLQGALIGNNGEMHHTKFGNIEEIRQIIMTLANETDPEIFLSVRTPAQLRGILLTTIPLTSNESYSGSPGARLGLFNDGMLGSVYDLGTYDDTPLVADSEIDEPGTRSQELLFQSKLCQYVPNGGEVVIDNEYNDLDNAISNLNQMHVSYLNSMHDATVLNKWKTSIYSGTDCFSGCSGYEYIQEHLGYRYTLLSSELDFSPLWQEEAVLSLSIANTGFSPAYRLFSSELIITNQESGEVTELETSIDNRRIAGDDTSIFQIKLDLRTWEKGTYSLVLRMSDPSTESPIHFANEGAQTSDTVPLGTLTLR